MGRRCIKVVGVGVGMVWSVLREGTGFGVVSWRVKLLEAGFKTEYGMWSEGNFHQGADRLGDLWLAG